MIGYPSGLWDTKNNLPIVRKGITATTPYFDYNGKREFLVDIAAFAVQAVHQYLLTVICMWINKGTLEC